MKFNILPGRGFFWNWVYKYTYDGKIYKKQIIYTAPDCTSSVFVFDDCTGPLSSSFNQCSFPLPLIARGPDSPIFSKDAKHPEIQNRRIHQKSRFAKSHRNPESSSLPEIQGRQIYQKSGIVKSTRNPGSSNLPEIPGRQIYQKSRVFKSTRNPESSNQPELLNQWLISMALF